MLRQKGVELRGTAVAGNSLTAHYDYTMNEQHRLSISVNLQLAYVAQFHGEYTLLPVQHITPRIYSTVFYYGHPLHSITALRPRIDGTLNRPAIEPGPLERDEQARNRVLS